MSSDSQMQILVEELTLEVLKEFADTPMIDPLANPGDTHELLSAAKERITLNPNLNAKQRASELKKIETMMYKLATGGKRMGSSRFTPADLNFLHMLTWWLKFVPGGKYIRKGIGKYLSSRGTDALGVVGGLLGTQGIHRIDPRRDLRGNHTIPLGEEINTMEEGIKEQYFLASSLDLKTGSTVKPTNGRDYLRFTTDPLTAKSIVKTNTNYIYEIEPQGHVSWNDNQDIGSAPYARIISKV